MVSIQRETAMKTNYAPKQTTTLGNTVQINNMDIYYEENILIHRK